jgi:putative oxygen-independent coproporphyrinogen III oxidase
MAAHKRLVRRASVYVHFPWCLAKCGYCDFVSYARPRAEIEHDRYASAVLAELDARAEHLDGREIGSIFFGGGTPSLWAPRALGRVLSAIVARARIARDLEVTVECNPTSLDADHARALVSEGVNRLSVGTQSTRGEHLTLLERLHDPAGARRAVEAALAAAPRVSTDLIFGLPDQPPEDAAAQADELAALGLSHLSCYQLTIEPGTRFGELARRGRLPLADEAGVAEAFLAVDEALTSRGLAHYEISNYARPGDEARHNLGYWRGEEYVGLGCAAYGFLRVADGTRGTRYRNAIEPENYMQSTRSAAALCAAESTEELDATALLRERIMLGLRLAGGFDLDAAAENLCVDAWTPARAREIDRLASRSRIVREGTCLRIPRDAWLFTDDTAARLF